MKRRDGYFRTKDWWVPVCDSCLKASCWWGEFPCSDYETAGVIKKRASELMEINAEHFSHYSKAKVREHAGYVDEVT